MSEDNREEILRGLEPMFKEAEEDGLWFWCHYQDLWFSPKQLREQHEKGSFIWGAVNWRLRGPQEQLDAADRRVEKAKQERAAVLAVLEGEKK